MKNLFISDQQNVIIFYGYENKSTDKPALLIVAALKVFFRISHFSLCEIKPVGSFLRITDWLGSNSDKLKLKYEPLQEKTCMLHMRKQRCRSTVQMIRSFVFTTYIVHSLYFLNFKPLAIFCGCTDWLVLDLVRNPKDRFPHDAAHYIHAYAQNSMEYVIASKQQFVFNRSTTKIVLHETIQTSVKH